MFKFDYSTEHETTPLLANNCSGFWTPTAVSSLCSTAADRHIIYSRLLFNQPNFWSYSRFCQPQKQTFGFAFGNCCGRTLYWLDALPVAQPSTEGWNLQLLNLTINRSLTSARYSLMMHERWTLGWRSSCSIRGSIRRCLASGSEQHSASNFNIPITGIFIFLHHHTSMIVYMPYSQFKCWGALTMFSRAKVNILYLY